MTRTQQTPRRSRLAPTDRKVLTPVRPNAGIEAQYRRKLRALIEEMHRSITYWIAAEYRKNAPELHRVHKDLMAADQSPAAALTTAVRRLSRRWLRRFDRAAQDLAVYFVSRAGRRSDDALREILRRGGFSVELTRTRAVNDVLQAAIQENVSLIKSIPRQYLTQVEGMVMRSVQTGRDLEQLNKELLQQFDLTKRRAALIARDQNNKATAVIQRTRQAELGITEAVWVHSGGGKEPRPSHLKAGRDRVRYNIAQGWFDPDEKRWIFPGELVNCRCVARPVVLGFS